MFHYVTVTEARDNYIRAAARLRHAQQVYQRTRPLLGLRARPAGMTFAQMVRLHRAAARALFGRRSGRRDAASVYQRHLDFLASPVNEVSE